MTFDRLREIRVERLLAVSDLHVDYARNRLWVDQLKERDYADAALLVAGDVSHSLGRFEEAMASLAATFAAVFFVPGNHDLWTGEDSRDSLHKLEQLEAVCRATGVLTGSAVLVSGRTRVQVVPLASWYHEPEESCDSLFVGRSGVDPWREVWADYRRVNWPEPIGCGGAADFLGQTNRRWKRQDESVPVVTFSHFLPRRELLRGSSPAADRAMSEPRHAFNFSRVAGSASIDRQLRSLGSTVHVYGHQHRNRDRTIEDVRYLSNCLGYPAERDRGHLAGLEEGPAPVWSADGGFGVTAGAVNRAETA